MLLNNPRKLAILLILAGSALLLVAGGGLLRAYGVMQAHPTRGAPLVGEETPTAPTVTVVLSGASMQLGPTAAAAATRLPPPTPIATPGPASERPAAPLRIIVPAVGIDARVVDVGWHVVDFGDEVHGVWETVLGAAGHHRGSADPGQLGNCVLSAHSSDAGGAVFRRLGELGVGDVVELHTVDGQRYRYIVSTTLMMDELSATVAEKREHAEWLDPTDGPVLTLVTCWPSWTYTHRIVVRADLVAS